MRPAERPVHFAALSLRSERLLRAGRSAAWPMPFRPGIPPRLRSVPRAPTCPRPKGPSHQRVMLPATRPEACACGSGSYALQGVKQPTVPTRDAATRWRRDGGKSVLPDGSMLKGGHQPTRPHRHSHSPSNLKVRPPAGGPALDPDSLSGPPGRVHVRCRWCGCAAAGSAPPQRAGTG